MATVQPIGKPENESERRAIAHLRDCLPDGHYLIYHNLELPTHSGLPYEYDLIVVGEHAVYAVEIKGYGGRIRGNAREWELESGYIHKSPVPLTNKKAKVVANRLRLYDRALDRVWVEPLVVLTGKRVRVQLNDPQADRVLPLRQATAYMCDPQRLPVSPTRLKPHLRSIHDAIAKQFRPLHRDHEIGDYRILETISQNERYRMFLAEHALIRTQGRFNLKVYSFDIYAEPKVRRKQREWTLRDANALHRLGVHSHIVRAHPPFPWQDNKIVLPLDWIDGFSLRGRLEEGTEIPLARKIDIMRQVCKGLGYVHHRGVIHRNMRPECIIIPHQGPIKLVDFDCARVRAMTTLGTPVKLWLDQRYAAPEVWENPRAASPASDQYAVGVILFELLTGEGPYEKIREVFNAEKLSRLPRQVKPKLPSQVDEIVQRMCAFEPERRYRSMAEAADHLSRIS